MKTFLIIYFLIGCLYSIIIKKGIDFFGLDYLLKDVKPEDRIDLNDTSVQIIFILVCVLLWPLLLILTIKNVNGDK